MDIKLSYIFFCLGTILGVAQNDSLSTPFFKSYDEKVTSSLYFIDTSKNHSRRWCSTDICGNRSKVGNFTKRKKDQVNN